MQESVSDYTLKTKSLKNVSIKPSLLPSLNMHYNFISSLLSTDVKVVYETPLRVFAVLPRNTSVEFCDYMFPDETLVDSANRFRDLIGIDVDENDIDETVEHVPSKS